MMLFCDLIKKLENEILPSKTEMNDLSLKATEDWNLLNDRDLEEKIKMKMKMKMKKRNHSSLLNSSK
jgi:hypothetical protein